MHFKADSFGQVNNPDVLSIRCPACRQQGTLTAFANGMDIQLPDGTRAGQRRCPNPVCQTHVFIAWRGTTVLVAYPPERIAFDPTDVPPAVVAALEEAITCHASGCFTAAAIMVRKTLEELCRDRGATGGNLKERLTSLRSKVVLPQELLDGLDDLRLLGNDAAHIESQAYSQVGAEEVAVGVAFAKEVLKAVYQYSNLLGRLRGLKKAP